jgi:hypothetical protein
VIDFHFRTLYTSGAHFLPVCIVPGLLAIACCTHLELFLERETSVTLFSGVYQRILLRLVHDLCEDAKAQL